MSIADVQSLNEPFHCIFSKEKSMNQKDNNRNKPGNGASSRDLSFKDTQYILGDLQFPVYIR